MKRLIILVGTALLLVACGDAETEPKKEEVETAEKETDSKSEKDKKDKTEKKEKKEKTKKESKIIKHDKGITFGEFAVENIRTEIKGDTLELNFNWINQAAKS